MEQLTKGTSPDFVNWLHKTSVNGGPCCNTATYGGIQVNKDGPWDVFSASSLSEESLVGASLRLVLSVRVGTSISLQTMLQEVSID
jgi:hypothetical protein